MGRYWDSKVDYRVDFIVPSQLIVIFVQGGHREGVGHPRREVARAAVRERKESGWEGSMLFPAAWPDRRLQRRRPESFPDLTPLAEAH